MYQCASWSAIYLLIVLVNFRFDLADIDLGPTLYGCSKFNPTYVPREEVAIFKLSNPFSLDSSNLLSINLSSTVNRLDYTPSNAYARADALNRVFDPYYY